MKAPNFASASPIGYRLTALLVRGGRADRRADERAKPLAGGALILASAALASAALIFDPAGGVTGDVVVAPLSLFAESGMPPVHQPGPNPPPG